MHEETRGRDAERPTDVPATGWWDIVVRTVKGAKADQVPLLAAGVAFYALLALAPALTALAGLYGLVADPGEASRQVNDLLAAAPTEVRDLVEAQLVTARERSSEEAIVLVFVGAALALWSASSGMQHLIAAVNRVYDEEDARGWFRIRGVALLLTAGAVGFLAVSVGLIAVLPAALAETALGPAARVVVGVVRWPLLAAAMVAGLSIVYRVAPDRADPKWRWVGTGSVLATILWLVGSAGFSLYAANFGRYDDTYGTLGAVVVVMLWLFLTAYCVILGAEFNAESERQTAQDTTMGDPRPMGHRDAAAADTLGPSAEQVKQGVPASADVSSDRRS